ncbi:MAG TPA: 2'-deoxycytidine 5'-triphosphate deaminase [Rhizomicrobium sp.]|nr:2'-deoxycytidine 5'-triphosphate deaminase [Rhizomicrobium sp.]
MNEIDRASELFAMDEKTPSGTVVEYPDKNGVLSFQGLRQMVREGQIVSHVEITPDQFQPASIDLRLGRRAWRVRASFLPGVDATVMDRVKNSDDLPEIDLTEGAVFEKGIVYVVELLERVKLTNGLVGKANPKSSTGRLDVLVRLITDRGTAFDQVDRKYEGPLYLEVAPQAFSIVVKQGSRLNQLRFHRGESPGVPIRSATGGLQDLYEKGQLIKLPPVGKLPSLRSNLVPVTVDLRGDNGIVGYKAKKTTNTINVDKVAFYDPREFWEKIDPDNDRLYLDRGEFYILATREEVGVPPNLAAEMVPYDAASGEFRVHYAGFFDPGFGWDGGAGGSRAVLEVRSYGVSFMLEHGQTVGWLNYSRLASGPTDKVYGSGIASNYQGQGVALAKHFKPWPK